MSKTSCLLLVAHLLFWLPFLHAQGSTSMQPVPPATPADTKAAYTVYAGMNYHECYRTLVFAGAEDASWGVSLSTGGKFFALANGYFFTTTGR